MTNWDPRAPKAGERAPDLELLDQAGRPVALSQVAARRPLLVLVFAGVNDAPGLDLLRDYRDVTLAMRRAGVSICGVGHADPAALTSLRSRRGLGFPLLSDADGTALSRWGMLDRTGLFLLDRDLTVRQRASGTRTPADEILAFVKRGGARTRVRPFAKVADFFHALRHALRPLRQAR